MPSFIISENSYQSEQETGTERIIYNIIACLEETISQTQYSGDLDKACVLMEQFKKKLNKWLNEYCKYNTQSLNDALDSQTDSLAQKNLQNLPKK